LFGLSPYQGDFRGDPPRRTIDERKVIIFDGGATAPEMAVDVVAPRGPDATSTAAFRSAAAAQFGYLSPSEWDALRSERRKRSQDAAVEFERIAEEFRSSLSEGDMSHCGLVISLKPTLAEVQTPEGRIWIRRDELYPPESTKCMIENGQHVPLLPKTP
jgi:hypothetical protein